MKLIDLANKIANGEELPKKIKFHNMEWELKRKYDYCEDYYSEQIHKYLFCNEWALTNNLNDEVEIIEQIEKLEENHLELLEYKFIHSQEDLYNLLEDVFKHFDIRTNKLIANQNKLIDVVNELKNKK